jgi:hypothetical protein
VKVDRFVTAITEGVILLGALNSPSPRSFFFTVPAAGKGSDNPFFRLLDSPGKSAEMF